jgi:hypothetical protein
MARDRRDLMNSQFRLTILKLVVEYCLLTLPVAAYVAIESIHKEKWSYLLLSPEWSVATIFITLQTYRLYTESIDTHISRRFADLFLIFLVSLSFALAINIYLATDVSCPSWSILVVKWSLFAGSSILYVYVAGAAIYSKEGKTNGNEN